MFTRFALTSLVTLMGGQAFAGPYDNFKCKFNDPEEATRVEFKLSGNYTVHGTTHATLTYDASIEFLDQYVVGTPKPGHSFVFAHAKDQNGAPYNGRKYQDHFKFEIEWRGVDSRIDRGILILSRLPAATTTNGRITTEDFTGVLDVSYNDHHGDYVWVKCTRRTFQD